MNSDTVIRGSLYSCPPSTTSALTVSMLSLDRIVFVCIRSKWYDLIFFKVSNAVCIVRRVNGSC